MTARSALLITASAALLTLSGGCGGAFPEPVPEHRRWLTLPPDIRVLIDAPASVDSTLPSALILFALPNGNTIEMTAGRTMHEGLDWHYDIQHIAAQTRFLRAASKDRNIFVAYLETPQKSWPAWRRTNPDNASVIARTADILRFETGAMDNVTLSGHSGGGSFINGFLNAYDTLPAFVRRIAYLDANYSFDDDSLGHGRKLTHWLAEDTARTLAVIAYDDREITLNGKRVVGPDGGTYRATQRMLHSFRLRTSIDSSSAPPLTEWRGFGGQSRFIVHHNPDTLILHTVLVERNGFIHAMLLRTPQEEHGYRFYGERVYGRLIRSE